MTALRIEDVWYPRISLDLGRVAATGHARPGQGHAQDYLPGADPPGATGKDGKFVLIVPVPAG